ncbi:MAG: PhoX family phosphatase [Vicinamibacterales bacterium]
MGAHPNRRDFLRTAFIAGGATMAGPLEALLGRVAEARSLDGLLTDGFGPLSPVRDEATGLRLLQLPKGFRYTSFGWIGDRMDNGRQTPGYHDGMAAFPGRQGRVLLVRNHEATRGPCFDPSCAYDPEVGGGTTTLEFDPAKGKLTGHRPSIAGTVRNCAGGPTPWGSWLTCEETLHEPAPGQPFTKPHGYVFEVPLDGTASCEPLRAMGRFVHEAAAVDPATGIVYMSEDAREAGLYRFVPTTPGVLADGGRLEMLAVDGRPQLDTRNGPCPGDTFAVSWVPIAEPERPHDRGRDGRGVFAQGWAQGAAVFARLEGCTWGNGRVYLTATSGGAARMGQVWELDPAASALRLVFESPGPDILNMPDNACPSPRGGLVLCEDGTMNPCVQGLTADGRIFRFARNNITLNGERNGIRGDYRDSEIAGATFSPDGQWLFFNVQRPGVTFAVTGPWRDGLF